MEKAPPSSPFSFSETEKVLEALSCPVAFLDAELRFSFVNSTYASCMGLSPEDFLGRHPAEVMDAASCQLVQPILEQCLTGVTSPGEKILTLGIARHFSFQCTPLYDGTGTVRGVLLTGKDVSGQKNLELERTSIASQLSLQAEELKEKNDQLLRYQQILQAKVEELDRSNKELEQFAFVASHDLKEPLRKIRIFYSQILKSTPDLPPLVRENLERSVEAAKRMQNLIDDLLAYSSAGMLHQQPEPIDLNKTLQEVVLSYAPVLEEKGGTVRSDELPTIQGVPFQMTQLFDNLINNALKYQKPGSFPVVQVSYKKVYGVGEEENKGAVSPYHKISFTDNGIGFSPENAEKIFALFQRLHTQQAYAGTGIGLAICKKIVLNHKGFLKASSDGTNGARFDIYLPA